MTKIADWRRRNGYSFAIMCPYYGLARFNKDLECLTKKSGVHRSLLFGDQKTEAYMLVHNLSPDLFKPADQYTHLKDTVPEYAGVGVDMTPQQAEAISSLLAEHFTGTPQASVANISLYSDILDDLNVEEMAFLNDSVSYTHLTLPTKA